MQKQHQKKAGHPQHNGQPHRKPVDCNRQSDQCAEDPGDDQANHPETGIDRQFDAPADRRKKRAQRKQGNERKGRVKQCRGKIHAVTSRFYVYAAPDRRMLRKTGRLSGLI